MSRGGIGNTSHFEWRDSRFEPWRDNKNYRCIIVRLFGNAQDYVYIYIKNMSMDGNKNKCEKCLRLISKSQFNLHIKSCDGKLQFDTSICKITKDDMYVCPFCEKTYNKKGIGSHIWRSHGGGQNHRPTTKGHKTWNKGLTKETDERVLKNSLGVKKHCETHEPYWKGKSHSEQSKKKISLIMSLNNKGGRCKWFDYKHPNGEVVKLQGTWEVKFAKILDIIDPNWIKIGVGCKNHSFIWVDEDNKPHYYTPDFYSVKNNKYYEIKGHWWGNDKLKMDKVISQNKNILIEVIEKPKLNEYMEKYGTIV